MRKTHSFSSQHHNTSADRGRSTQEPFSKNNSVQIDKGRETATSTKTVLHLNSKTGMEWKGIR